MGDTREQQATFTKLGGFSWITAVSDICLFLGEVDLVTKAQGHTLTFGSNAYVSVDRRVRTQVDGLLNADISQGVFSKDRTSIKVGSHEATEPRESLLRSQTLHVGGLKDMLEVIIQISDVGVHSHL